MKKILFVLVLFVICWSCNSQQTKLNGHIENYHGEVVRICTEGSEYHRDTLQVDSVGNFVFVPIKKQGLIYKISVKDYEPWISVYMAEGDQSNVFLTLTADKQIKREFSGDRVVENEYLQAYTEVENSRDWYGAQMKGLSFEDYRMNVEICEHELQKLLDKIQNISVKKQLASRQHLMLQRQLVRYSWRCLDRQSEIQDVDFNTYMKSLDVNNSEECDDEVLGCVINWNMQQRLDVGEDYLVAYLNMLDTLVTNTEIKDQHATNLMMKQFQFFSGNSLDASMKCYNALCVNDSLKKQVNNEYAEYERVYGNLLPGKLAPEFEMMSLDGKKYHLSDLRGKYLFIDFWATWCAPCREEIPYMAKLQEYFAHDSRIALISISVDANVNSWRKFLEKEKPEWAQYVVDAKNNAILEKEYRIFGIPHFMLLDPEGYFIAYTFTRPSSSDCAKMIEQAIK